VQGWHNDRALPLNLAYEESAVYDHVDGSVLLSFSCLSFACIFDCVQKRCLSTVGAVESSCGPAVNPRTMRSSGAQRREDQGHIVGLDVKPLYR
jgi:hypothetical protein